MPKNSERLPYKLVKLATDMFARDTDLSGPEIHDIYADYTDALGALPGLGRRRSLPLATVRDRPVLPQP